MHTFTSEKHKQLEQEVSSEIGIHFLLRTGLIAGIWRWDLTHPESLWLSSHLVSTLGYSSRHFIPSGLAYLASMDELEPLLDNVRTQCDSGTDLFDRIIEFRHQSGKSVWLHFKGHLSKTCQQLTGIAWDVSLAKEREQYLQQDNDRLSHIASNDELTGLPNRRGFFQVMDQKIAASITHQAKLTLAIIDLDDFKQVNDQYGHQQGDHLLCTVADILRKNIRQHDIACRLAGDEFMVLIDNANADESQEIADRIRSAIEEQLTSASPVTVSIGLSTLQVTEHPLESEISTLRDQLIFQADIALYEAKRCGRNQTSYYQRACYK